MPTKNHLFDMATYFTKSTGRLKKYSWNKNESRYSGLANQHRSASAFINIFRCL